MPGGPGSQWRMTKLRRVFETASSEGRPVLDVARERYDSLQEFEDAKEERRILDARSDRRDSRGGGRQERSSGSSTPQGPPGGGGRYMFTSDAALNSSTSSRPGSRAGFRRPGEEGGEGPRTPGGDGMAPGTLHKADLLRRSSSFQSLASGPPTPIPSVLPPTISRPAQDDVLAGPSGADDKPVLSASELNKLQAAVLKAKLMEKPNAAKLEQEYDVELRRSRAAGSLGGSAAQAGSGASGGDAKGKGRADKVEMVPTVDGRGRLYDVGLGAKDEPLAPGAKRKRPEKVHPTCIVSHRWRAGRLTDTLTSISSKRTTQRRVRCSGSMPTTIRSRSRSSSARSALVPARPTRRTSTWSSQRRSPATAVSSCVLISARRERLARETDA